MTGWIVSMIELDTLLGKRYKMTRRFPSLGVSDTRFFRTERAARRQYLRWLEYAVDL